MSDTGRILIVDDDARNIARIEQALAAIDREPLSAGDGAQALAVVSRLSGLHGFAGVVITDMKMPVMDGLELLERLRAIDGDLPVILITAYGDVASAVKAMKNGAYDFIERPFDADMLRIRVVRALEKRHLVLENRRRARDLSDALAREQATGTTLAIVTRSQADPQPVFDAIAENARRLCDGDFAGVFRFDGTLIFPVALLEMSPDAREEYARTYPRPLDSEGLPGRAILARAVVHVPDVERDPDISPAALHRARVRGRRSTVAVPMLLGGEPVGTITVSRREPRPFTDAQIALLKTFADQAVIAIESARHVSELEARNRALVDALAQLEVRTQALTRSVGELRALGEVGQAISSTLDLQTVLSTVVARATQLTGVDAGVIYEYEEEHEVFAPRATERLEDDIVQMLVATPLRKGQGATGRLAEVPEPIQLADLREQPDQTPVREVLLRAGYRALLAVPLVREGHLIGGLTVFRKAPGAFAPDIVDLLRTLATQSALAIQNARLFREVADKSRELELASQHKSTFLANMSHELRTPLNAIIGFSEVLVEGMVGAVNDKQTEYLNDILESGRHLLSLINDILDLSKIEAGRMELEVTDFDLPQAIDNAVMLVRERAGRLRIALHQSVEERLREIRGDERKVKQVLLNLLSNALKFTPEGGRIEVRAAVVGDMAEVSVMDTGPGIAPEDHEAVFEEFRQVGTAAKKVEGTGLGLALSRKFIELHGGRISVKSRVGAGATFTFTLPLGPRRRWT